MPSLRADRAPGEFPEDRVPPGEPPTRRGEGRVWPTPRTPDLYAAIAVAPQDVQAFRPHWSEGRCRAWLLAHEAQLRQAVRHYLRAELQQLLGLTLQRQRERQRAPVFMDDWRQVVRTATSRIIQEAALPVGDEQQLERTHEQPREGPY